MATSKRRPPANASPKNRATRSGVRRSFAEPYVPASGLPPKRDANGTIIGPGEERRKYPRSSQPDKRRRDDRRTVERAESVDPRARTRQVERRRVPRGWQPGDATGGGPVIKKTKTTPRVVTEKDFVTFGGDEKRGLKATPPGAMVRVLGPHPEWPGEEVVLFSGTPDVAKIVAAQLKGV